MRVTVTDTQGSRTLEVSWGYDRHMARIQTMVQLSDELRAALDAEAKRLGVSRSALIREAIEERLHESSERDLTQRIVAGYTRIPPAFPDKWGSLEDAGDVATLELAQRLDAEERAQGFEPW